MVKVSQIKRHSFNPSARWWVCNYDCNQALWSRESESNHTREPAAALLFQNRCNRSPGASSCYSYERVQKIQYSKQLVVSGYRTFLTDKHKWMEIIMNVYVLLLFLHLMNGGHSWKSLVDQSPTLNHWSWRSIPLWYLPFIERLMEPFSADSISAVDWYSLSVTHQTEVKASTDTWGLGTSNLHQTSQ